MISVKLKIKVSQGLKVLKKSIQASASAGVECFHVDSRDTKTPANRKQTSVNLSDGTSVDLPSWLTISYLT